MKGITKHFSHYASLIGILIFGLLGFLFFNYERGFQVAIAISMALSYVSWGIVHHYIHRDLDLNVFIEYVIIALLGLVIMLSLLGSV